MCDGRRGGRSMNSSKQVRLAGSVLDKVRHVCAFFHNDDEKYRVIVPFICEGLGAGDCVFLVVDEAGAQELPRQLAAAGIDVDERQRTGQLALHRREDAYLRDGCFDPDRMLALIESTFVNAKAASFRQTRFVADMEWPPGPGAEEVVRYQQRLGELGPKYDDVIVSTYACAKLGAGMVMDVLRTHPIVIIGGILQKNPFFVSPEEFLRELRERPLPEHGRPELPRPQP